MTVVADVKCVVCEQNPAVLYCQQDDAHLCAACDHQVHSANPLASRHVRVPIQRAAHDQQDGQVVPEAVSAFDAEPRSARKLGQGPEVAKESLSFDDDAFFAVPDVDMPSCAVEEPAGKAVLGKSFVSDEFDFGEIDPLWLDRLDVGLDRLPSDILDSLVPEAPPAKAAPKPSAPALRQQPSVHPPAPEPMQPAAPHPPMPQYMPAPMVPHHMYHQQPPAEVAPAPVATEAAIDIDSYIPRSLLPIDAAMRVQQLRARREKLERFREKKRNRHFRKTIRYASRKAYAEVRPRIKGRFARKDEVAAMRAAGLLPQAVAA